MLEAERKDAPPQPSERFQRAISTTERLLANVETVVRGKNEQIRLVLAALACRGHVLFEDVPGNGEDGARALDSRARSRARPPRACSALPTSSRRTSRASRCSTSRRASSSSIPARCSRNMLLVDEINRAMPKTQSALLEAMAEHQVTVDGVTHAAPGPVPADGDGEPDRAGGHVPAARGAARPLLPQDRARLPDRRRGDADRPGPARGASADAAAAGRLDRRGAGAPARDRGRLPGPADPALDRRARASQPRPRGDSARRVGAREPRARARLRGRGR